jgi:hypothetical protein
MSGRRAEILDGEVAPAARTAWPRAVFIARPFRSWEGWPSSDGWIRCRLKPGCGSAPEEQPCRLRRQRIAGSGRNICARAPCGSHVPARTTTRRSRSTAMFSACRLSKTSPTASAKTERSSVSLTRTSSWRSFERAAASLRRTRWTCWSCTCPERQRSPRPPNHCVGRVCQRIRRHTRTGLRAEGSCTWTPMAAASSSRRGSTVTSQNPPAHPAGSQGRSAHRLPVMDLWQRLEPCAYVPCRPSDTCSAWPSAGHPMGGSPCRPAPRRSGRWSKQGRAVAVGPSRSTCTS